MSVVRAVAEAKLRLIGARPEFLHRVSSCLCERYCSDLPVAASTKFSRLGYPPQWATIRRRKRDERNQDMDTLPFWQRPVFQMFASALIAAALVASVGSISSIAAPEEQTELHPFLRAARSAERIGRFPLKTHGDALKLDIERYMWKDVYMMGEIYQIIEIPSGGGNNYQLLISTVRQKHETHDANVWRGGAVALRYWDTPNLFSVSDGDIVEFVATVSGFHTFTSTSDHIVTLPLLEVVEFREMEHPGTVEKEE